MGCNCGCNSLSQLQFQGIQGVGISSVTTEETEEGVEVTFHLSDGSSFDPILIPAAEDGEDGSDGADAEVTSYIYQSNLANPVETIVTGTTGYATTDLSLPANTLSGNGDTCEFWIDLSFPDGGLNPGLYSTNVHINTV
jgi:hypothetical protein